MEPLSQPTADSFLRFASVAVPHRGTATEPAGEKAKGAIYIPIYRTSP